ncbi:UDP-glucuronic acid decarboxylase family protein [Aurantimonas sp. 22II-16-19i]|uniref:UDP-glucuronic acid decarboxylase family protein n=1 Tax=Aurantimonas sp. 22II-16-19i TaxID=1317114 RepID=UPI0009F7DB2E|nr:UDP-glucuronic acid decarboxylase family protein [Aurantimonas sp. 22II-16-19i]ORE93792.1 UDP-glucose epimerase YtcB [Aurantimonas sp. 22II-16-19i]
MKREDFATGAAMKRILVAGGAGFLGSHLCEILVAQGHHVTCVDNLATGSLKNVGALTGTNRFTLLKQDVCDPLPEDLTVHEIYNLACAASPPHYQADPIGTMMTCVVGTNNLLALAERCGARFLQASTSEVYGDPQQHPQTEAYWGHVNPTGPRACYDEGKRAAETLCFDYLRMGRADVRVVRIFNTYGPRMRPDDGRIISNLVCQALAGEPLTIYGTGEQTRSFCYASDLIRGLVQMMAAKDNPGAPVNFGNPGEFTINELAELVLKITGSSSKISLHPLPVDDPQRRRPDISRAHELFGWQPEIPLTEGLGPTIAWFAKVTRKEAKAVMKGVHLAGERSLRQPEPVAVQRH